jgi:hypothetical protein
METRCSLRRRCQLNFPMVQNHLVDQSLLIIKDSRSHSDTPHSVGLLWTSYQSYAETSTWQNTTLARAKPPTGFELAIPASEQPLGSPQPKYYSSEFYFTLRNLTASTFWKLEALTVSTANISCDGTNVISTSVKALRVLWHLKCSRCIKDTLLLRVVWMCVQFVQMFRRNLLPLTSEKKKVNRTACV